MPSEDKLLATIEAIHAAGLDDATWPAALQATAELIGGHGATLEVYAAPSPVPMEVRAVGLPPPSLLKYIDEYAALSPRVAYVMNHPREELLWDYKFIDDDGIDRDPYYAEFLPQGDCRYYVACRFIVPRPLPHRHDEDVGVSVQRSARAGHVGEAEITLLQKLRPHYHQAFDTSRRLRAAAGMRNSMAAALDWLTDGAALLGHGGELIHANEALQSILRSADGIRLSAGRIEFAAPGASARLVRAFASVSKIGRGRGMDTAADFPVARPSGAASYHVSVRPIPLSDRTPDAGFAMAIVFVRDPLRQQPTRSETLRATFGLTPAEASLALALCTGEAVTDYARKHRLSMNTVYTHLRRIKEKTGCRRQAELIHRLNGAQLPVRHE